MKPHPWTWIGVNKASPVNKLDGSAKAGSSCSIHLTTLTENLAEFVAA